MRILLISIFIQLAQVAYCSVFDRSLYSDSTRLGGAGKDSVRGKAIGYYGMIQMGALMGCSECATGEKVSMSSSLVQGILLGPKARVGIAAGYDTYRNWGVASLSGVLSYDVLGDKNKNAVTIQLAYGGSHAYQGRTDYYFMSNSHGNRTVNTQLGYRMRYGDLKVGIWIGYKYQRITTSARYPTYYYLNSLPIIGDPNQFKLKESLNRFQLMISIGWK